MTAGFHTMLSGIVDGLAGACVMTVVDQRRYFGRLPWVVGALMSAALALVFAGMLDMT